jgi:hypothetical protein
VLKKINFIPHLWQPVKQFFTPPTAYSWQTFAGLTLFSFTVAAICWGLEIVWVREFCSSWAQLFLIVTLQWWGITNNVKLIPWLTGALVCFLFFGNFTGELPKISWVIWPLVSAAIAVIPDFLNRELKFQLPKPEQRPAIIAFISTQALLSCWIQFYFVVQTWVADYPALLADDLGRSAITIDLQSRSPQAVGLLNEIALKLAQTLEPKSWSEVQQWLQLQDRLARFTPVIRTATEDSLTPVERQFWEVEYQVMNQAAGYELTFTAFWQGPQSSAGAPLYEKTCWVQQDFTEEDEFEAPIVSVACERAKPVLSRSRWRDRLGN